MRRFLTVTGVVASLLLAPPAGASVGSDSPTPGGGADPTRAVIYAEVVVGTGAYRGQRPACSWALAPSDGSLYTVVATYDPKKNVSYRLYTKTCGGTVQGVWVPLVPPRRLPAPTLTPAFMPRWVPTPELATAPPNGSTWVNLGTWFWTTTPWEPVRAWAGTFDERGNWVWAETTATPVSMTFAGGDGQAPATCHGAGQVWTPADGDETSSECMYTYQHSSVMAPNGTAFATALAIEWSVSWIGSDGSGGPLPPITTTTNSAMHVGEIQAIVTG